MHRFLTLYHILTHYSAFVESLDLNLFVFYSVVDITFVSVVCVRVCEPNPLYAMIKMGLPFCIASSVWCVELETNERECQT